MASADLTYSMSTQLGKEEIRYVQKRWYWVNWCPATESQEKKAVHGTGEAAQKKQPTEVAGSAHR